MKMRKTQWLGTLAFGLVLALGAFGTATAGDGKSCGDKKDGDKSAAASVETRAVV